MDEGIHEVEGTLGHMGQRCNSRAVDKIHSNYTKLSGHYRAQSMYIPVSAARLWC